MGSFKNQTNALLRKSVIYQKRNICTNICLLTAPIIFSILLLIIQLLINNVFLSGDDFKCGCQCTQCCLNGQCQTLTSGYCNPDYGYTCVTKNTSNCGVQFSSGRQAGFCSIPYPSSWPALVDTPAPQYRVISQRPATSMMVSAATPSSASGLGQLLVNQLSPLVSSANLLQLMRKLGGSPGQGVQGIYYSNTSNGDLHFNGYILSELGIQLGSSASPPLTYYVPNSFQTGDKTFVLLPAGTCEALNISQSASMPLTEFLAKYGNLTIGTVPNPNPVFTLNFTVICTDTNVTNYTSVNDVDNQLYCGYQQSRCNGASQIQEYAGAWDFADTSLSNLNVDVYYNATAGEAGGGGFGGGNGARPIYQIPAVLNMAAKAWWRYYVDPSSSVVPPTSLLGVMSFPKGPSKLELDFSSLLGPLFYCWVVQLLLPTFLQQLVYEKENRLRMMMKMHGLGDGAYWLITYCWYMLLYIVYIIIFIVFGTIVGLKYFRKTNYGIQIIFYFLHGQCMIAFAFMLSSLFTSALTAVVCAYLYVFASGLIGSLLLQIFMNQDPVWIFFVQWVPAWSLYRGLYEMGAYAFLGTYRNQPGMQFDDLSDPGNGMVGCWGIFIVEWVIFMVLGWYFEQVISSGNGIRRHPLFFLECLWRKKQDDSFVSMRTSVSGNELAAKAQTGQLADVYAECQRVDALTDFSDTPIVMKDIKKVYPGLDGGKPKTAVRSLTLGIQRGECFGLLGPNGAGKTTAINVLVGFLEPSGGTALVEGLDIRRDMQQIYQMMGVCPQHDLLWATLTAEEHLLFYGRLKGMQQPELGQAVAEGLRSVNLLTVATKQAGKYSGGMKRRLSVAISFIGSPKVVFLDEPSTGLDPASRRGLWDVVKDNKPGRALILTTHSMEEAEMLCDRLGIFVDGQLVCIGNPKEITNRYAGYLVFSITVPQEEEGNVTGLVNKMSCQAVLTYSLGGTFKYELPTSDISLSGVFAIMNEAQQTMTVLDWGVANATLEEVFIKFARATDIKLDGLHSSAVEIVAK